jgi:orotate phosphoribosyltransferase
MPKIAEAYYYLLLLILSLLQCILNAMSSIIKLQNDFIEFLVAKNVIKFGSYTLKSGRQAPYFVNTGLLDSGAAIAELGRFYCDALDELGILPIDLVFGPAYKGIPLAVATAAALSRKYPEQDVAFAFNRKEIKDHGDKGMIVGRIPTDESKIVIVEDVITAGTTMDSVVPLLVGLGVKKIAALLVAVDRCEKGRGEKSAAQEVEDRFSIPVKAIVTIHQVVEYVRNKNLLGEKTQSFIKDAERYLAQYGA